MRCPTLNQLPPPPPGKTGWPWTEESPQLPEIMSDGFSWPRISIVTPSYNQGQFIEETIRSVLLQGYPNLEYIIIDRGSTDNILDMIEKYEPWLAYWVSEIDCGQSHAINKGFERATGEIVAWLNADDIYLPGTLLHVAREFAQNKSQWIVGITRITDEELKELDHFVPQVNTGKWKVKDYQSLGWLDFVMTHQSGTALPQPSSFWSRKAIMEAGPIDEASIYAMDLVHLHERLVIGGLSVKAG